MASGSILRENSMDALPLDNASATTRTPRKPQAFNALCHMGSNGLARFGSRRKAPAIKLHDIVFHCHEGKAAVTWYKNTNRNTLVFDDLLHTEFSDESGIHIGTDTS